MGGIFLSYERADGQKAARLAALLEGAGFSVWWDRRIKGGAQFSGAIEAALAAADKVVVLWSSRSVGSAWVRDEAAVGRDSGRLVPVRLDATQPPLGFRQFQTIDLSGWKGGSRPPQLEELLDAVGPAAPEAEPVPRVDAPIPAPARIGSNRPRWLVALLLAAVAVVAGGWLWSNRSVAHIPTVAITGANERSSEVARQLAVRLGDLRSGRGDPFKLTPGTGSAELIVQIDATENPTYLTRDLNLVSGDNKSVLWSASLKQPRIKGDDLTQQLTLTAERVLSCAGESMSYGRERIDTEALKAYLAGCTRFDDAYGSNTYDPAVAKALEQVIAKAPHFEPAWAKLLVVDAGSLEVVDDTPAMRRRLRGLVDRARSLGIDIAELYAAEAALHSPSDFVGLFRIYDDGIKHHPNDAILYRLRGEKWQSVGRMNDSVVDSGRAVQIDPLSPANQQALASALAYAGNIDAGDAQLRKAEQMWPSAQTVIDARYRLELRYGDPKVALAILQQRMAPQGVGIGQTEFLKARIDPTPENIERAISAERKVNAQFPPFIASLVQALGYFHRNDDALKLLLNYKGGALIGFNAEVLFRPAMQDLWRDPKSMAAAAHLGLLHYWKASGKWPDFCFDPTLPYDCKNEAATYRA